MPTARSWPRLRDSNRSKSTTRPVATLWPCAARADAKLSASKREQASQAYTEQALNFLQRAKRHAFFDKESGRATIAKDPDLDDLRGLPEFQQLLHAIQSGATPGQQENSAAKN